MKIPILNGYGYEVQDRMYERKAPEHGEAMILTGVRRAESTRSTPTTKRTA